MSLNQRIDKAISLIGRFQDQSIQTLFSLPFKPYSVYHCWRSTDIWPLSCDSWDKHVKTQGTPERDQIKKHKRNGQTSFNKDLAELELVVPSGCGTTDCLLQQHLIFPPCQICPWDYKACARQTCLCLVSLMPRQPDVMVGDGERVAWRCISSFSHIITALWQFGVQKLITFNPCLMLLAQIHGRCFQ